MKELIDTALQDRASETLGASASLIRTERVSDTYEGVTAWERDVSIFSADDGRRCYAWREHSPDSEKDRIYTVLKAGPVNSARDAVRASLMKDYRDG